MDYRLVPYIKKYLHEGHSLEQIRQSLLSQGIPDVDIKQAAIYAMDEGTSEIKNKTFALWIIPVILILMIGGAGYYFQDPIKIFATDTISRFSGQQSAPEQQGEEQQTIQQNMPESCDMECLVAAAENCKAASTEFESELDFFGMIISSKNQYTITSAERCSLNIKVLDTNIEFSQELRDKSIANGITEEELNMQLEESRKSQKLTIGKEGVCIFQDNSKLKEFLEKIRDGTFSGSATCTLKGEDCTITQNTNDCNLECEYSGDWTLGECKGTMFLG